MVFFISSSTLEHLHFEYCSTVCDPPASLTSLLESVQHIALEVVVKNWSVSYFPLLTRFKLVLSLRRLHANLILLYKIHLKLCFFPNPPFHVQTNTNYYLHNHSHNSLSTFLVHTSSFYHSFFPSTIRIWNKLKMNLKITLQFHNFNF